MGNFLDMIHAMYKALSISLLYNKKVTELFYRTTGLKQGDRLSTIFF